MLHMHVYWVAISHSMAKWLQVTIGLAVTAETEPLKILLFIRKSYSHYICKL